MFLREALGGQDNCRETFVKVHASMSSCQVSGRHAMAVCHVKTPVSVCGRSEAPNERPFNRNDARGGGCPSFFGRKLTDGSAYLSREGKRPGKWSRATCVAPR